MYDDLNDNYELKDDFKNKIKVIYINKRLKKKLENLFLMKI
jgi:hypothetical protein